MATERQKQDLLDAVIQIRKAEVLLLEQSRTEVDTGKLIKINTEYTHLDSYLSQLLHTQAITDDDEFDNATTALKGQASSLAADEAAIKKIIGDVQKASKIAGYLAKAASLIAGL